MPNFTAVVAEDGIVDYYLYIYYDQLLLGCLKQFFIVNVLLTATSHSLYHVFPGV